MLNDTTKRKINSLRDILVGKVPDPKSQVEQITNALIYKYMDDMDQQAIAFGGKASFFMGEYQKYSWKNLMDPKLGGQDRMNLYTESLEKMSLNKNLSPIFRDILKGAFLPYRSPETLNMFLHEIDGFSYDHSEDLGDAFEYLLAIMGSQGDAGQFRTPRHIIDFIVDVVDPKKNETILDPACGTAGFLISAYKHILENNNDKKGASIIHDEMRTLHKNFTGYDISPEMVKLSRVNMFLHNFPEPKIFEYDSLSSDERWDDNFDVILANPPFMTPKGGIIPHKRFSVPANRAEVLFVDYIMNHLRPKGRAGIIVPEGIIFQSGNVYKQLRKNLVEDGLYAVVSLPSGVFAPYSGVKTSILLFNNEFAKKSKEICFVKVENDGFDLGAQRREIPKNDLPIALDVLNSWSTGKKVENKLAVYVEKSKIAEGGDYNLSIDRYHVAIDYSNAKWSVVELGKVAEISAGNSAPQDKKFYENGIYPFFRTSDVGIVHISDNLQESRDKLNKDGIEKLKLFPKNTILFPKSGASTFLNHRAMLGIDGYVSSHLATIISNEDKILPKFLFNLLKNVDAKFLTPDQAYPSLKTSKIAKIKIPLPPLEIQEQIVAELDGYQKIIDGAKQIAQNWKPKIDIDPEWKKVKLGDVADVIAGQSPEGKFYNNNEDGVPFYQGKTEFNDIYLGGPKKWTTQITKIAEAGDILMSMRAPVGPVNIATQKICIGRGLAGIRVKNIEQMFLFTYLKSIEREIIGNGGAVFDSISKNQIEKIKVPFPDLKIQKQIVEKIEAERALVESAKKLIGIYEQKTKDTIAKLWDK
ncbi:MAG: N-6 DNA methylase [Candidatus Moraniibacteriota bacterium]